MRNFKVKSESRKTKGFWFKFILHLSSLILCCAFAAGAALAQQYPSRPIRAIVVFPPGGPTDVVARIFAQELTRSWAQQVVVDNRVGAGGNIGM